MSRYQRAGWRHSPHNAAHGRMRRSIALMVAEPPVCEDCGGIGFVANPNPALPRMVDCPRCATPAEEATK